MKNVSIVFFVLVYFLTLSCHKGPSAKNEEFVINGNIKNCNNNKVLLYEVTPVKSILIDSVKADPNGQFNFKEKIKGVGLYDVKFNKNNFIRLLADKGENIELSGDLKNLYNSYEVDGSEGSRLLKEINQKFYRLTKSIDSLQLLFKENLYSSNLQIIKQSLDSTYRKTCRNYKKDLTDFINKHSNSIASLVVIYQKIGKEDIFDINNKKDFELYNKIDNLLMSKYPENMHVIGFHKTISEHLRSLKEKELILKNIETGAVAPDIRLADIKGNLINLSSLKGKVVLLDFWASWCKPCRAENKELLKFYKKYNAKGFEIFSVSLDKDKESWEKAIIDDNIKWKQVSDLKYWSTPYVKIYNVEEIPYTILIDKNGKIVKKGITGEELENTIKEQLVIKN